MMLADYYLVGLAYTAISIMGVGLAITTWLRRAGLVRSDSASSLLLTIAAAGIYWNTIVFLLFFAAHARISGSIVIIKCAVEAAGLVVTALITREQIHSVIKSISRDGFTLLLTVASVLLGTWAMLQFPHVLDSSQLAWTQQVLDGDSGPPVSAMMGYSGLIVFLGALFSDSPLVTTAAALKPLLLGIHGCLSVYVGECIDARHRRFYVLSFFALSLLSFFGSYGLVQLGKDSVWGIIFAVAFMATLCGQQGATRAVEAALYFAVAATTGVIAVPYMVMFYALWLVLACPPESVGRNLTAMAAVNLPIFPTVLAGFLNAGLLPFYAIYVAAAFLILAAQRLIWSRVAHMISHRSFRLIPPVLPLLFLAPCLALLPVALRFPVWINPDGSPIIEVRPPLDGHTNFIEYFLSPSFQKPTVALGLAAALLIGFTPLAKRQPGLIALAAAPFAVLLLALLRAHSTIHVISDFNVWDMVRDIPLWLGGTVFVLLLLAGCAVLTELLPLPVRARPIVPVLIVIACLFADQPAVIVSTFASPVYYSRYAGFSERDMAAVSSLIWQKFRGYTLWLDPELNISKHYFYSFQMFGARAAVFDALHMNDILMGNAAKIVIVSNKALAGLGDAAAKRGGKLEYLDVLQEEPASFVQIIFNGHQDLSHPRGVVTPTAGNYAREKVGQTAFNWMRAEAHLSAVVPGAEVACVTVSLFDTGLIAGPQIVHLTEAGLQQAATDIAGHTAQNPAEVSATVNLHDGSAILTLKADAGERSFPNEARKIAYGLVLPIEVAAGHACTP